MINTVKRILGLTQDSPTIGSIELWAGLHVPRYFALCEGQRMSIRDNPALFSVIGTEYGGDAHDYFCLPDYRPRDSQGQPLSWSTSTQPRVLICVQGLYPSWD